MSDSAKILCIFAQQREIERLQKIIEDLEEVITTVRRVNIHSVILQISLIFQINIFTSSTDQLNTGAIGR